jgi:hypothetical protein
VNRRKPAMFSASAKTGLNVQPAFESLARTVMAAWARKEG